MRVMTWNIHGAVGMDGHRNMARILEVIRLADPDILALQEVDNRKAEPRLLELLPEYKGIEAAAISAPDGDYGQMLLSRWPLNDVTIYDISAERREPRRLISAGVATPRGAVRILATHLGLRFNERAAQAALLCEQVRDASLPTIALGDFNDWFRWYSVQPFLDELFLNKTTVATFPSRLPFFALDRIYWTGALGPATSHALRHASLASDHLPLLVVFGAPNTPTIDD